MFRSGLPLFQVLSRRFREVFDAVQHFRHRILDLSDQLSVISRCGDERRVLESSRDALLDHVVETVLGTPPIPDATTKKHWEVQ